MQVTGASGLPSLHKQGTFLFSFRLPNLIIFDKYLYSFFFFYQTEENNDCYIHEGYFISPLEHFVSGILPPEAVKAR